MLVSVTSVNKWKRFTKLALSRALAYSHCQSMPNTEWVRGITKGSWFFVAFKRIWLEMRIEICTQMKKISLPKITSYPLSYRLVKLSNIFYSSRTNALWLESEQVEG